MPDMVQREQDGVSGTVYRDQDRVPGVIYKVSVEALDILL